MFESVKCWCIMLVLISFYFKYYDCKPTINILENEKKRSSVSINHTESVSFSLSLDQSHGLQKWSAQIGLPKPCYSILWVDRARDRTWKFSVTTHTRFRLSYTATCLLENTTKNTKAMSSSRHLTLLRRSWGPF